MSSNRIERMICKNCGEVHAFPDSADSGIPKKFPAFRVGEPLRLDAGVFAERFPDAPLDQNVFVIAGPLADRWCSRTIHCAVKFDRSRMVHRYRITVRWTGCVGDTKVQRKIDVWADDASVVKEGV